MGSTIKITTSGTLTTLYSFGSAGDGGSPQGSLIQATDGNLYGITYTGGAHNLGTVFKVTLSGTEAVLYNFTGSTNDGANPSCGLIQATDGNLYGMTFWAGVSNLGTVFKITVSGVETLQHSFAGNSSDGASPSCGLIQATDSNFYGMTFAGGAHNLGTVFKIN